MNSQMNILIRVNSRQARTEMAAMSAAVKGLGTAAAAATKGGSGLNGFLMRGSTHLQKFGKNLQWTGQQLTYNFTLPLVLAGAAATKWALDNTQAMTEVTKVYGDASSSATQVAEDLERLASIFKNLSSIYGVNQAEVIRIGASWAQAGAQGLTLARATRLTMDAMILGGIDAERAQRGLLTVMSAFKLNTTEAKDALALLNVVENTTSIKLGELLDVFTKTASSAQQAGFTIRELAAAAAALVPATGTGATAGNALKTIISRVMAPTKQAAGVLREVGIEIDNVAWTSMNATDRMRHLAERFNELTQSEKAQASAILGSRYQLEKFDVLMQAISDSTSQFNRALNATGDAGENLKTFDKELQIFLQSDPQKFKRAMTIIQNSMADVIIPLLPAIIGIINAIGGIMRSFSEASPEVKSLVMSFLLLLAIVGPLAKIIASFSLLFGTLGKVVGWVGTTFLGLGKATAAADGAIAASAAKGPGIWARMGAKIASIWGSLMTWLGTQWAVLQGWMHTASQAFARAWMSLKVVMAKAWASFTMTIAAVWTALQQYMIKASQAFGRAWTTVQQGMILVFQSFVTVIRSLQMAMAVWWNTLTLNMGVVWLGIHQKMAAISAVFTAFWKRAVYAMQFMWLQFSTFIGMVWKAVIQDIQFKWLQVHQRLQAVSAAFKSAWLTMQTAMYVAWTKIIAPFQAVWNRLHQRMIATSGRFTEAWVQIKSTMARAWGTVSTALAAVWVKMHTRFLAISAKFTAAWIQLKTAMVEAWTTISTFLGRVWVKLHGIFMAVSNKFTAAWIQLNTAMAAAWTTIHSKMLAISAAFQRAWLTLNVALYGIWLTIHSQMLIISRKFAAAWLAIQTAMARAWLVISIVLAAAWGKLHVALLAISATFSKAWVALVYGAQLVWLGLQVGLSTAFAAIWAASPALLVAAIVAALALLGWYFREEIGGALMWVVRAFGALPRGIASAMRAVVDVIARAVKAARDWLSYLNPFQRHSPSLVDNVNAGVDAILRKYAELNAIGVVFRKAITDLEAFKNAISSFTDELDNIKLQQDRLAVQWATGSAGLQYFDNLRQSAANLSAQLGPLAAKIRMQVSVIKMWEAALKAIDVSIEQAQATIAKLQRALEGAQAALGAAQDHLAKVSSYGIAGQQAMNDAIFENEMAQKRLRLELARMGEDGNIQQTADRLALLAGEIETLQADASELRGLGAGSDVLGPLEAQIAAIEAERAALEAGGSGSVGTGPANALQAQLDALARQGEILQLEASIEFDPLQRQLDAFLNPVQEMEFGALIATIGSARAGVEAAEMGVISAQAALDKEQKRLEELEKAREDANDKLDEEKDKLDELEEAYKNIEELIREMNESWQGFADTANSALQDALRATEEANRARDAAAGAAGSEGGTLVPGDFGTEAGSGFLAPEFDMDLESFEEDLQKELDEIFKDMEFKPFAGLTDWFNEMYAQFKVGWARLKETVTWDNFVGGLTVIKNNFFGWGHELRSGILERLGNLGSGIWDTFHNAMGAIGTWIYDHVIKPVVDAFTWLYDVLVGHSIIPDLVNAIVGLFNWFKDNVVPIVGAAITLIIDIFNWLRENVWPVVVEVFTSIAGFITDTLVPAFQWLWEKGKLVFESIAYLVGWWWNNVLSPIFTAAWRFISDTLIPIFQWLWEKGKFVFESIAYTVQWWWNNVLSPVFKAVWAFITDTLIPIFQSVWEKVRDSFNSIKEKVQTVWEFMRDSVFQPIWDFVSNKLIPVFQSMWEKVSDTFGKIKDKVKTVFDSVKNTITGAINIAIDAINKLIGGINKIAEILPGDALIHIDPIPNLAGGGSFLGGLHAPPAMALGGNIPQRQVGSGFVANRPRAIVGEGNPNHREFVVPTDPRYRGRAMGLFGQLANDLGVPGFAFGGFLPSPGDIAKGIKDIGSSVVGEMRKGMVTAAFQPFLAAADALIGQIPWNVPKESASYAKNEIYNWAKGTNDEVDKVYDEMSAPLAGSTTGLDPEFLRRYNEYNAARGNKFSIVSGFRSYAQQAELYRRYLAGTGNLAAPPGRSNHERGLAIDHGPNSSSADRAAAADFRLHYPVGGEPWHVEPFASGGFLPSLEQAFGAIRNDRINSSVMAGMVMDDYSSIFTREVDAALQNGGRIVHRPGGALLNVAEGKHDEGVQVLPIRDDGKGKSLNFYGNLVFPNVTNGEDAEAFVRNLENLGGK